MTTQAVRAGIGHDTHRLTRGGPLVLGGVILPHDMELVGHSDADVLLHAIIDALLGAAALGDIGQMFPEEREVNRGRDSAEMLSLAYRAVAKAGWQLGNVDSIVFAQRPKLTDHREAIRRRLAEILDVAIEAVSLKAKTGERVGPVGRLEAIEAQGIVLLFPR